MSNDGPHMHIAPQMQLAQTYSCTRPSTRSTIRSTVSERSLYTPEHAPHDSQHERHANPQSCAQRCARVAPQMKLAPLVQFHHADNGCTASQRKPCRRRVDMHAARPAPLAFEHRHTRDHLRGRTRAWDRTLLATYTAGETTRSTRNAVPLASKTETMPFSVSPQSSAGSSRAPLGPCAWHQTLLSPIAAGNATGSAFIANAAPPRVEDPA